MVFTTLPISRDLHDIYWCRESLHGEGNNTVQYACLGCSSQFFVSLFVIYGAPPPGVRLGALSQQVCVDQEGDKESERPKEVGCWAKWET